MFVLKFVPTIYHEPALQVLTGYFNKSANGIAHFSIHDYEKDGGCSFSWLFIACPKSLGKVNGYLLKDRHTRKAGEVV